MPELIEEFADHGFDTFSLNREMLAERDAEEVREAVSLLRERGYGATVHCGLDIAPEMISRFLELLGGSLLCITFDRASTETSIGSLYDIKTVRAALADVAERTGGSKVLFGVEDFPLDAAALEHFRAGLEPFVSNERFGTLIDLGHLNYRLRSVDYWRDITPEEYIAAVPVPIIEIHVHDNDGVRDDHAYIGYGNGDFEAMARGLRAIGFDGVSTIEVCRQGHQSAPAEARLSACRSLEAWRAALDKAAGRSRSS
jgi:sugar phosphate isomerase/epimerase